MWIYLLMGTALILMGLAVHGLKWYFLISGYNTMSKEKQAKVDTKRLGRLMGLYSYVNGGIFVLVGLLQGLGFKPLITPVIGFFIISTGYFLVKAQKYDGNIYDEAGKLRQGAGKQFAVPILITLAALLFTAGLLFVSAQATRVTVLDEGIEIHGIYGEVYPWESMETVKLVDELPAIELRTNGSALGSNLKGHFKTKEFGSVKLFVNTENPPFIYLEANKKITIFNLSHPEETRELSRRMLQRTD